MQFVHKELLKLTKTALSIFEGILYRLEKPNLVNGYKIKELPGREAPLIQPVG